VILATSRSGAESFLGGVGVFVLLGLTVAVQVWFLFGRVPVVAVDGSNGEGQTVPVRRVWWRALALFLLMAAKTAIVGGSVYWCLWVRKMTLFPFAGGLVVGLFIFLSISLLSRSRLAKMRKYH
jgi:hypothetical protein